MKVIKQDDLVSVIKELEHELQVMQFENKHFGFVNAEAEGYLHGLDDIVKRIERLNLFFEVKERKPRKKKESTQLSLSV